MGKCCEQPCHLLAQQFRFCNTIINSVANNSACGSGQWLHCPVEHHLLLAETMKASNIQV